MQICVVLSFVHKKELMKSFPWIPTEDEPLGSKLFSSYVLMIARKNMLHWKSSPENSVWSEMGAIFESIMATNAQCTICLDRIGHWSVVTLFYAQASKYSNYCERIQLLLCDTNSPVSEFRICVVERFYKINQWLARPGTTYVIVESMPRREQKNWAI